MLGADWTNGPPEQTKGRAAYRRPGNWDTRQRFSPLQIFSGFTENMLLTRREQQSLLKPTPEAISKIYFPGAAGPWSTMSEQSCWSSVLKDFSSTHWQNLSEGGIVCIACVRERFSNFPQRRSGFAQTCGQTNNGKFCGEKSLCTRLEFQGVTVCIEPINKICKKINSIQQFVERRLQFLRSNPG